VLVLVLVRRGRVIPYVFSSSKISPTTILNTSILYSSNSSSVSDSNSISDSSSSDSVNSSSDSSRTYAIKFVSITNSLITRLPYRTFNDDDNDDDDNDNDDGMMMMMIMIPKTDDWKMKASKILLSDSLSIV